MHAMTIFGSQDWLSYPSSQCIVVQFFLPVLCGTLRDSTRPQGSLTGFLYIGMQVSAQKVNGSGNYLEGVHCIVTFGLGNSLMQ